MPRTEDKDKPTVEIKPHTYQPSKAELDAQISLDTSPDDLARSVLGQVKIVRR